MGKAISIGAKEGTKLSSILHTELHEEQDRFSVVNKEKDCEVSFDEEGRQQKKPAKERYFLVPRVIALMGENLQEDLYLESKELLEDINQEKRDYKDVLRLSRKRLEHVVSKNASKVENLKD